ncbi:MAG: DUF4910 domain-containing protein [Armatimonadetes bacterium]|nr:DUF4910 domain-containing protein [Armatimonadota bacterium]
MYRPILNAITDELNLGLCLRDIANHWACRCTVPGPGMRKAGGLLVERYRENGAAEAEMIPYPADDRTEFLDGRRNPLEWRARDASLAIVAPASAAGVICRYRDEPLSLVSNSTGTPPEGICAPVVVRSAPLTEADVAPGEFRGKLLLVDQPAMITEAAARKGGALGVLSDGISPPWLVSYPPVREPEDAPDLVMWSIFAGRRDETPLFGFNLSPRQGRRLRQLIARSPEPVLLRAVVDAELREGSSDFVHAALPGTDLADEEVWVLAHLSEPGARDNASGCCLSLELARTLAVLTASGKLPPPRRTLRFMHAVEVGGFVPYLDAHRDRLSNVVAAVCLDSVGQDFAVCGGQMVLYRAREQAASFTDALIETLLGAVAAEPASRFSSDNYAVFPWRTAPFWGNDAFISDGFFGIPTPQLSGWPDRFYHSSQDTPDQMSRDTLGRVGAVVGTYLHLLATAGAPQSRWLGLLAAQDWKRRISQSVSDGATAVLAQGSGAADLVSLVRHLGLQGQDAVAQAACFAPDDGALAAELRALAQDVRAAAEREAALVAKILAPDADLPAVARVASVPGEEIVARRLRWRVPGAALLSGNARLRLSAPGGAADTARVWQWIDGRRTAREVWERLQHGGAIALPTVVEYLRVMAAEGMVALVA